METTVHIDTVTIHTEVFGKPLFLTVHKGPLRSDLSIEKVCYDCCRENVRIEAGHGLSLSSPETQVRTARPSRDVIQC